MPVKGNAGFVFGSSAVLAELAGTVTDHYIVNFRAAAEFLFETLFCSRDESFVQLIFYRKAGSEDILVKLLLNEREVTLPVKTDKAPYYHWKDVRRYWQQVTSAISLPSAHSNN